MLFINPNNYSFIEKIIKVTEGTIRICFQCGKCTSGCPTSFIMDASPRKLAIMSLLGLKDRVLSSHALWVCVSCRTCTSRCPRGVKIDELMDYLKHLAIIEGYTPLEKGALLFYDNFTKNILKYGRVFEPEIMLKIRVKTGFKGLKDDVILSVNLLRKGRIRITPEKIRRIDEIRILFEELEGCEDV